MQIKYYFEEPIVNNLILDTFKAAYGVEMDYKVFEWRFINNPVNEKVYINYIIEDGLLASYYAVSPVNVYIAGENQKMALSCMTMTHPLFQGKGYFKMLALDLYNKLKEDGFIGVFGFANQNSHYGFRKNLGWIDLFPLNLFSIGKESQNKYLISSCSNFSYSELPLTQKQIENTKSLKFSNKLILPDRSIDFLIWRLLNNPVYNYFALEISQGKDLKGVVYYKFYDGTIDIMEVYYEDINDSEILLKGISYLIDKYNCNLNICSNLQSDEHLILEKVGFKEKQFLTYFGVIPFTKNIELLNLRNWHYRFIDSDVF